MTVAEVINPATEEVVARVPFAGAEEVDAHIDQARRAFDPWRRLAPGSFAPTAIAWGYDNRTCALRVVGHGDSLRVENRVPGGDVNPYLAVSALVAAGLHGIEHELPLEPEFHGNAYDSDKPTVPVTLREAADLLERSEVAEKAFGADVVAHYLNAARIEVAAFDAAVTDWERIRGFERM